MSLFSRMFTLVRARTSAALDQLEDPRESLDYAYSQQQELLRKVRRGLIDVATSRNQLEQQAAKLRSRLPHLETQALRALESDREDLARIALQRKQAALAELQAIEEQAAQVADEERKLTSAERQLSLRVDEFRTRRQTLAASYTAAESQVRLQETLTGVSGEFAELSISLGRAEEKIDRMRARAMALDSLIDSGALDLPGPGGDPVERELRELAAARAVEEELAALKAQRSQTPEEGGNS